MGVDNQRNVLGLEKDISLLGEANTDHFQLKFNSLVNNYLGKGKRKYVRLLFHDFKEKTIAFIDVRKCRTPTFVKRNGRSEFYTRSGNSSEPLNPKETMEYIQDRWPRRQSRNN